MSERVAPDYGGGSIVNLAASLVAAFGVEPPAPCCRDGLLPSEPLAAGGDVALVVCDAAGLHQLQRAMEAGRTPNLCRLAEAAPGGLGQLTSVFPSTTTAALTSLSNARAPCDHGMLGHRLWLEELGSLCNMLRFTTGSQPPEAFDEEVVRAVPTVYELLAAAGVSSNLISSADYEGTAFTALLSRGAAYLGYRAQSELPHLLESCLKESVGRSFHFLYWPMIDTLSHQYGPVSTREESRACLLEFEFIDLMVGHVAEVCRGHGCSLVITADHGQVLLDPEKALLLEGPAAEALRYPPGGGRRAWYLAADDLEELVGSDYLAHPDVDWVYSDEAVARGWFGGDCGRFRSRLGDVVSLPGDAIQLVYDYGSGIHTQRGSHGGMTAEEMLVPLLAVPAAAW